MCEAVTGRRKEVGNSKVVEKWRVKMGSGLCDLSWVPDFDKAFGVQVS
jgi:hypothetical protein